MFSIAMKILEKTESRILDFPSEPIIVGPVEINGFMKKFIYWWYYTKFGITTLFKSVYSWVYVTLSIFCFLLIIHFLATKEGSIVSPFFLFASLIAMPLILFSVPSTYVANGVKNSVIQELGNHARELGLSNQSLIEFTEQSIEKLKERCLARISTYKWFLASIGALALLLANFQLRLIPLSPEYHFEQSSELIKVLLIGYPIMLVPTLLVAAYKRASIALFSIIEFSLIEVKAQVVKKSEDS